MKVLVTGSNGFIGKNLIVHLSERKNIEIFTFTRGESYESLRVKVLNSDFIFHLAGINRPLKVEEFKNGNSDLTLELCKAVRSANKSIPIVYTSSIQVDLNNPYGASKREAEEHLQKLSAENINPVYIFRLPNVFGKWAKPNYNSVVATFCYNILNDLNVQINDPDALINLVYVDDVVSGFLKIMDGYPIKEISPIYQTSVGDLEKQIRAFKVSKDNLITERVGEGFIRALYSTYISYFTPDNFKYPLIKHEDPRGVFVEMIKTKDSGQFSFFTAHKGITRGGHYHHTKTEKFLVLKGEARFCFRHILTNEKFEIYTKGSNPEVIETIPGWTHDITNVGEDEMIVMLWANEIFDREKPDTITCKV